MTYNPTQSTTRNIDTGDNELSPRLIQLNFELISKEARRLENLIKKNAIAIADADPTGAVVVDNGETRYEDEFMFLNNFSD